MMKKRVVVIVILGALWGAKLQYDLIQSTDQIDSLKTQITQVEQSKDNLNDQFVALQRQVQSHLTNNKENIVVHEVAQGTIDPVVLIRQHLQLVYFAVQQHQDLYAIEQIQVLRTQITQYSIAPALQQSLYEALDKDQQRIEQYHNQQAQQLIQLNQIFEQLNDAIQKQLTQTNQHYQPKTTSFWQRWFDIQPVQQAQSQLMNQNLVIKEIQLKAVLAQQQLTLGQYVDYQKTLNELLHQLNQAPSINKTEIYKLLNQAKQLPIIPAPQLATLGLI